MKLLFATNNDHKLHEIRNVLQEGFELISLKDVNLDQDIPEDEPTIEGNALSKARYIYDRVRCNVFADDTGLEVDALNGEPGVYSARYAGEDKNFDANIDKVLNLLADKGNRKARFRTVIALIIDEKEFLFEGIIEGQITKKRSGSGGFGYDPVFLPAGESKTFAEMPLDDKNRISHRALAFRKLVDFLIKYNHEYNNDVPKQV